MHLCGVAELPGQLQMRQLAPAAPSGVRRIALQPTPEPVLAVWG